MGMNVNRGMGLKTGESHGVDARSINNNPEKSDSEHVENMRNKLGTEFTGAVKQKDSKRKNELGKDDFMKLMSAQLKYQDPISPMKNEQMAAQLAQFSALEQMVNLNTNVEKLAAGQKPSEHMIAASLIGKRVTTDSNVLSLEKDTQPEIGFNVPTDAQSLNVAVVSARGEVVREFDLGEMKSGQQSVRWDGKNGKGQSQPIGEYTYKLTGLDKDGKPMQFASDSAGVVTGVTFEGGKSLLLVDGKKVPIDKIGKIEDAPGSAAKTPSAMGPVDPNSPGAAAKGMTEAGKQKSSSAEGKNTSTQVAKNSLPPGLTPENIKSMLAAQGMRGAADDSAGESSGEENKTYDPMWNPATN
jgi:flagellar basal-body rod modification protein FlgD